MNNLETVNKIKNKLIISVQSAKNEPLYNENAMNALIDTVVLLGKIDALRLAGERDIKNTRKKYPDITIIGITKPDVIPDNYKEIVYITPTIKDAKKIIDSGADIIAFDGTMRQRPNNENLKDIIDFIHLENKTAMADISTFEEAKNAFLAGADIISTTLSGYTKETSSMPDTPDFNLLEKCTKELKCPVISEGKIWNKEDIKKAFDLGAHSVVIGSAVTRPHKIIEKFKEGLINGN